MATGVVGTASMLRARRRDVNVKPNRRLDRKSSRGMLYENEELRLRTININAEVERGQNDIKKLRRENEQLRREIWGLREEYDRLEGLLGLLHGPGGSLRGSPEFGRKEYGDAEDLGSRRNMVENEQNLQNITCIKFQRSKSCSKVEFDSLSMVDEEIGSNVDGEDESNERMKREFSSEGGHIQNNLESIFPAVEYGQVQNCAEIGMTERCSEPHENEKSCFPSYEIPTMLEVHHNNIWSHSLYTMNSTTNSYQALHKTRHQPNQPNEVFSEIDHVNNRRYLFTDSQGGVPPPREIIDSDLHYESPSLENAKNLTSLSRNANFIQVSYRNKQECVHLSKQGSFIQANGRNTQITPTVSAEEDVFPARGKSLFPEGGNLDELLSDVQDNTGPENAVDRGVLIQKSQDLGYWNSNTAYIVLSENQPDKPLSIKVAPGGASGRSQREGTEATPEMLVSDKSDNNICPGGNATYSIMQVDDTPVKHLEVVERTSNHESRELVGTIENNDILKNNFSGTTADRRQPLSPSTSGITDAQLRWLSKSMQNISAHEENRLFQKRGSFPLLNERTHFETDAPSLQGSVERTTPLKEDADSERQINQEALFQKLNKGESEYHLPRSTLDKVTVAQSTFGNCDDSLKRGDSDSEPVQGRHSLESENIVQEPVTNYECAFRQDKLFSVNLPPSPSNMCHQGRQNPATPLNSILKQECEEMKDSIIFSRSRTKDQHEPEDSPADGMYRCIKTFSKTNRKCSGYGSHFQSLHKMSVIVGDTQQGRSLFVDHSLSSSCWQDSLSKEQLSLKQVSMCSNSQRKMGFCARKNIRLREGAACSAPPVQGAAGPPTPVSACTSVHAFASAPSSASASMEWPLPLARGSVAWERANSVGSMASSIDGRLNITKTKFGAAVAGSAVAAPAPGPRLREDNVPWCGCWGNGCI